MNFWKPTFENHFRDLTGFKYLSIDIYKIDCQNFDTLGSFFYYEKYFIREPIQFSQCYVRIRTIDSHPKIKRKKGWKPPKIGINHVNFFPCSYWVFICTKLIKKAPSTLWSSSCKYMYWSIRITHMLLNTTSSSMHHLSFVILINPKPK